MQREIKFRAWDTKAQKFITQVPCLEFLLDDPDSPVSHHDIDDESGIYFYPLHPMGPTFGGRIAYQQYTGLKDKNEEEIYEGDIAKYCQPAIILMQYPEDNCEIIWRQDDCDYMVRHKDNRFTWKLTRRFASESLELVGNIYENPELLKK